MIQQTAAGGQVAFFEITKYGHIHYRLMATRILGFRPKCIKPFLAKRASVNYTVHVDWLHMTMIEH